jgi:hypothetical protein
MSFKSLILSIDTEKYYPQRNWRLFYSSILLYFILVISLQLLAGFLGISELPNSIMGILLSFARPWDFVVLLLFEVSWGLLLFTIEILQECYETKLNHVSLYFWVLWAFVLLVMWGILLKSFMRTIDIFIIITGFTLWSTILFMVGRYSKNLVLKN